jgi:hypothetical protein
MKWISIAAISLSFAGRGAALSSPPEQQPPTQRKEAAPNAAKVAGTYYSGDGLGFNCDLTLKADGTYTAESYACMGKSGDASGKWHVSGNALALSPGKETGIMKRFTKTLDIVERNGDVVFVEPYKRQLFKKSSEKYGFQPLWCFQRTDEMKE